MKILISGFISCEAERHIIEPSPDNLYAIDTRKCDNNSVRLPNKISKVACPQPSVGVK